MSFLKNLYWDVSSHVMRHVYIEAFLRSFPGSAGMYLRECWYRRRFKRAGKCLKIFPGTTILHPQRIECGDNVLIGVGNYIQAGGGLVLGSDAMLGPFVKIWTQNHNYHDPDKPVWDQGYTYDSVFIGRDVWVGANAFIMPGAHLGDKCVVSACSVVGAKTYPEGIILAGHPARKIGDRRARNPERPMSPLLPPDGPHGCPSLDTKRGE